MNLIERAEKALEGVNEGPWRVKKVQGSRDYWPHYGVESDQRSYIVYAQSDFEGYGNGSSLADATFIAGARTLIPELIAEIKRLTDSS